MQGFHLQDNKWSQKWRGWINDQNRVITREGERKTTSQGHRSFARPLYLTSNWHLTIVWVCTSLRIERQGAVCSEINTSLSSRRMERNCNLSPHLPLRKCEASLNHDGDKISLKCHAIASVMHVLVSYGHPMAHQNTFQCISHNVRSLLLLIFIFSFFVKRILSNR